MLQMNGPKQSGAQVHCNLNPAVQETQILGNIQDTNISVTSRTSGEGFEEPCLDGRASLAGLLATVEPALALPLADGGGRRDG